MSYPSSQLQVPIFWIEYFRYIEVLTPSHENMQAVMKTGLKNESTYASFVHAPMMSQNWVDYKHKITLGPPNKAPSYFSPFQSLLDNHKQRKHLQLYCLPCPNHNVQCRLYLHGREDNGTRCWKKNVVVGDLAFMDMSHSNYQ
jgi:hypothetical protein